MTKRNNVTVRRQLCRMIAEPLRVDILFCVGDWMPLLLALLLLGLAVAVTLPDAIRVVVISMEASSTVSGSSAPISSSSWSDHLLNGPGFSSSTLLVAIQFSQKNK